MMRMRSADAYKVEIFIAGDLKKIEAACAEYCATGYCVTVTPTKYIFKGGFESGAIIGLINYARFPTANETTWSRACELGKLICRKAGQFSFTVQDHRDTLLFTNRPDHIAQFDCESV